MIIFLSTQELAFRGNDESVDSDNQGNFKELAKFAATLDENFKKFTDPSHSSVFTGLSKTIQNDLIESTSKIIMQTIRAEINNATCFSWEIDETTDISCFSQMSIIFRFVHNVFDHIIEHLDQWDDISIREANGTEVSLLIPEGLKVLFHSLI
ncbi:hypothetical protein NQ315_004428 [Exocentrus adspersus]|uniref:DUF4371 domain-containing protein n=1 Tax=Exocentrus adspersus TaxID=1586481 RepID=A0AAV8VAR0_9CUCU|nr:hypothetical protein NQ315_004428 [Exocentrus adspersus]